MRWILVILSLVGAVAVGCDWPGALAGNGTNVTETDAGVACSVTNPACADCQMCAENGPCVSLVEACAGDADCASISSCAVSCSDSSCLTGCYNANPNGMSAYQALATCVYCTQCPCAGKCM